MMTTSVLSNDETFYHTSYAHLQNVQPTQNGFYQLATGMEAIVPSDSAMSNDSLLEMGSSPFLEITVQPSDRFRFRYKSESGSHGKLRGAAKGRAKTNFPTVKLHNYDSQNKIEIKASLYTHEEYPKPHVLELVGRNCVGGTCSQTLSKDKTAMFCYLEIESKKKEELIQILSRNKVELYEEGYDEEEIKKEVQNEIKALNMNAAILCFEAWDQNNVICQAFSVPIKNLKSAASDLKITRLSLAAGRCSGGEDMILLCDKISKDDIKIRFYEKDEQDFVGGHSWEDYGVFNKCDVHHQVAIAFKTPPYQHKDTEKVVYIDLYRPSDNQSGEPLQFTYIPDEIDVLRFSKKRKMDPKETASELSPNTIWDFSPFATPSSNLSSSEGTSLGSPSTSSSNDDNFDLNNLVDIDNFVNLLCKGPIEDRPDTLWTELNSVQMDAASAFPTDGTNEYDISTDVEYNSRPAQMYPQFLHFPDIFMVKDELVATFTSMDTSYLTEFTTRVSHVWNSAMSYLNPGKYTEEHVKNIYRALKYYKKIAEELQERERRNYYKNLTSSSRIVGNMAEPVQSNKTVTENYVDSFRRLSLSSQGNSKDSEKETDSLKEPKTRNFEDFKKGICGILGNLEKGAFLCYLKKLVTVEDENGNTFLHWAVLEQSDNMNLINMVIKLAPNNVNKQNKFQETPMHLATTKNIHVLLLLMKQQGDASIKNKDGNNCIHLAAKSNRVKIMQLLLYSSLKNQKYIPSVDAFNYEGLTPLHVSIVNNSKECLQLLLQAKADVNLSERKTGRSPLHFAVQQQPSLIVYLISHPGIYPYHRDFRGYKPFETESEAEAKWLYEAVLKSAPSKAEGQKIREFMISNNVKPRRHCDYESSHSESCSDSECEDENIYKTEEEYAASSLLQNTNSTEENVNTFDEDKLCKLLDTNGGWKRFGILIGIDLSTLNKLPELSPCPSKLVFKKFKKLHPDWEKEALKNLLEVAGLKDIVRECWKD